MFKHFDQLCYTRLSWDKPVLTRVDLLENVMFDVTEHATLEGFGDKGKQRDWTIVLHVRFDAAFIYRHNIR